VKYFLVEHQCDQEFTQEVSLAFSISPSMVQLLWGRGLRNLEEVRAFVYPQLTMLPSPEQMNGMERAVEIVVEAIAGQMPIFIHGDYDVDGMSATALLSAFFREIGVAARWYVPNRITEKYGISVSSIHNLVSSAQVVGGGLLITVDCGISAVEEVAYAQGLGLHVLITDHHQPPPVLPGAEAILNPRQANCAFPYKDLAGVGVAFYLVLALRKSLVEKGYLAEDQAPNLKKYLDFVALGTVADVMPLTGLNRVLVKAGLEVLSVKCRPGVLALCEQCSLQDAIRITAEDISFRLAPRINASGRLGNPGAGVGLLLAESMDEARDRARTLEQLNITRKSLETAVLPECLVQGEQLAAAGTRVLAVYYPDVHPGILGILASRLLDRFALPCIVFTDDRGMHGEGVIKGSGRSTSDFNLYRALGRCNLADLQFGGHALAVGVSLKRENLAELARQLHALRPAEKTGRAREVQVDCLLDSKSQDFSRWSSFLQLLEPFGEGNPEPVFLFKNQQLRNARAVRGHLLFQLQQNGVMRKGVGFNLADAMEKARYPVDFLAKIKRSSFRGMEHEEVRVIHLL
jgi:single-stranded-DNA-specific exonuclease